MRIVQINSVCDYGSTGHIVGEISDELTNRNIENYIVYSKGKSCRKNVYCMGNEFDRKIHAFLSRLLGMQGYFSYFATKKMLRFLDKTSPDIVHLHNLHSNFINMPMLFNYLIKKDIAAVITLHDTFMFTGKCVHYTIAGCKKWMECCGECPQLESGNKSWFFDKTNKMLCDKAEWYTNLKKLAVIGVSEWITNEAKQSILKNADIIETVYNWIDLKMFYPHQSDIRKKYNIKEKHIILGVSLSWSSEKGIDDFNRLADMLDERFKIVLVGRAAENVNKRILNIERTSDMQTLSDLYSAAEVFYNPTRRETFGKVTAEALACGTPVIVYNTTACPELVGDGCGYVEAVGDITAVYNDIIKIAGNKQKYTDKCRLFAEKSFDKIKKLDETIELYKNIYVGNYERQ